MRHATCLALLAALVLGFGPRSVAADGVGRPPVRPPARGSRPTPKTASAPPAAPAPDLAATINGHDIPQSQLEQVISGQLLALQQNEYQLRLKGLQAIAGVLLEQDEAKARGISVDEYLRQEIRAKVADPREDEIMAVSSFMKDKLPGDPKRARAAVIAHIRGQAEDARRKDLDKALWQKANVEMFIEPPRAMLSLSPDDVVRGPADAPVTIIEFGDFQCEQCANFETALRAIESKQPGTLRRVFREMPLSIHEHSRDAAEIALCARDQGKFWELHDWMFAHQDQLAKDKILEAAPSLGIDVKGLGACLEAQAHSQEIERDLSIAQQLGSNTTPTVLINGRLFIGSAAIAQLPDVVADEVRRAARTAPATAAATTPDRTPR